MNGRSARACARCLALALSALFWTMAPGAAIAQDRYEERRRCLNEDNILGLDRAIAACTAIIERGRETDRLAPVFFNRATHYIRAGIYDARHRRSRPGHPSRSAV